MRHESSIIQELGKNFLLKFFLIFLVLLCLKTLGLQYKYVLYKLTDQLNF